MILTAPVVHEVSVTECTCIFALVHEYTIINTDGVEATTKEHQEGHVVRRIFNDHRIHLIYCICTGRISMMAKLPMRLITW